MIEENSEKTSRKEYMKEYMKQYRAKNKEKLNLQKRIKNEAKALKKKAEDLIKKNAKIDEEIKKGNLNYSLQEDEMSFEEFKRFWAHFGDEPSFEAYLNYIKDKRFRKEQIQKAIFDDDAMKTICNVPVMKQTRDDCLRFRGMYMKKIKFDAIFIDSHMTCPACKYWYVGNKDQLPLRRVIGVDLWAKHGIHEERISDQDLIKEEMNRLYKGKHNHRIED